MTVINAADRFRRPAVRDDNETWIALRSGGVLPLSEFDSDGLILDILDEVFRKYPYASDVSSLAWDDVSGTLLEVLYRADGHDLTETRGSVGVDGYEYQVTLTAEIRGGAA